LIIGNTFSWPLTNFGVRAFSAIMGGGIGRAITYLFNGVVGFFFRRGVVNKLPPEVWDMYLAPFKDRGRRHPTHIFPKQLMAANQFLQELENGLPAIQDKPALILWGDRDFAFKEHERDRFRKAFPDHRDIQLTGAGHFIQEDAPDEISAAIADWYGVGISNADMSRANHSKGLPPPPE
jgi:haloalkane dehalogenase